MVSSLSAICTSCPSSSNAPATILAPSPEPVTSMLCMPFKRLATSAAMLWSNTRMRCVECILLEKATAMLHSLFRAGHELPDSRATSHAMAICPWTVSSPNSGDIVPVASSMTCLSASSPSREYLHFAAAIGLTDSTRSSTSQEALPMPRTSALSHVTMRTNGKRRIFIRRRVVVSRRARPPFCRWSKSRIERVKSRPVIYRIDMSVPDNGFSTIQATISTVVVALSAFFRNMDTDTWQ